MLIVGGQKENTLGIIEDGFFLTLTDPTSEGVRAALMNGRELRLAASNGTFLFIHGDDAEVIDGLQVVLLTHDDDLRARCGTGSSVGRYAKAMVPFIARALATQDLPAVFDITVAIRPGRRSRVWTTSPTLSQQLDAVRPPSAKSGAIAFVLRVPSPDAVQFELRSPPEWAAAGEGGLADGEQDDLTVEEVLDRVWPECPAG